MLSDKMAVDFLLKGEGGDKPGSLSTFLSPAARQQASQAFNEGALLASSYYQETGGWPLRAYIRQPRTRSSCRRAVLTLMASLAALLMLITACSLAERKKDQRRNSAADRLFLGRKLSEKDKAAPKPPEVCGETHEAREDKPRAGTSAGGAGPPTKKRKTTEAESRTGEDAAGPSGASPPFEGGRKATAKKKHLKTKADEDSDKLLQYPPDWEKSSGPSGQLSLTSEVKGGSAVVTTSPGGRTSSEVAAAQALLLLRGVPSVPTGPAQEPAQQEELESQQPSTSAAVSGQGAFPSGLVWVVAPPALQQPQPTAAGALANHPFCRIPPLQTGVVPRAFNPEQASNRALAPASARTLLLNVRELLLKDSLCKEDADYLVLLAEGLAAYCNFFERTPLPVRDIGRTAEMLAFRFLLLDSMGSALIATGQTPPITWWQQFANPIPHDISHTPQGRDESTRLPSYYGHLARRLSRALATFKSGFRPSVKDVYDLKCMIFSTGRPLQRFRAPFYDPWRTDCPGSGEGS